MLKIYLPARESRTKCLLIFGGMVFIYLMDNLSVAAYMSYEVYSYIVKPLLWVTIIVFLRVLPESRPKSPLKMRENIILWAFIFSVIFIMVYIAAGFIDGFGKSPYSRTPSGMLLNLFTIGTMLAGREGIRGYVVNNMMKKERFFSFVVLSLIITLLNFPVTKYSNLKDGEEIVKFIAESFAPEFSHNLLATYLAFLGGWPPALVYMGTLQAFLWFSPVLPNLEWITTALVGIMCPVFSLSVIQNFYMKETRSFKKAATDKEGTAGWIITSIAAIGIIWFSVGVFPVYPSVIATGSMEPMIKPGDMILLEKITAEEDLQQLEVGDIIQFRRDNILISHRIMQIVNDENNNLRYRTKGDNNNTFDSFLVKPEDIKGKILYVIPKVGWVTLLIKKKDDVPLKEIEF